MIQRMIRAARLDGTLYQELQDDPTATIQAFVVVILSGTSIALALIAGFAQEEGLGAQIMVLTSSVSAAIVAWVVVGLLASMVGRRLLGRAVTLPIMLRAIGFANAPGILYIFIMVRGTALLVNAAILLWILFAMMIAFRMTLRIPVLAGFWLSALGMFIVLTIRDTFARAML